jgi:fatty acid synthase subunit alpha, fungi type
VVYDAYKERNRLRYLASYKAMSDMMISNSLVKIKESPPYTPEVENQVLLNSLARASLSPSTAQYSFTTLTTEKAADLSQVKAVSKFLSESSSAAGVGVDQGASCSSFLCSLLKSWQN